MYQVISKEEALRSVEKGSGYWAAQCHTPIRGTNGLVVVYLAGKFYLLTSTDFQIKVHKVLHWDQQSMIVSHEIRCSVPDIARLVQEEMTQVAEKTKHERWAQDFLQATEEAGVPAVVTPRQGRRWHNRFYIVPVDTGGPPGSN